MQAAFCRLDITPHGDYRCMSWGGATATPNTVILPLQAAVSLFESAGSRCCLISLDLATVPTHTADRLKAELSERVALDPASIFLNASHTHTGPGFADILTPSLDDSYEHQLIEGIVTAVLALVPKLADVRLSTSAAPTSGLNRNRRRKDDPVDTRLRILRVDDSRGRLRAILWHFAAHPLTYHGPEPVWCSDYPGAVAQALAQSLPDVHTQFLQGAAGDVYPLDWYYGLDAPSRPVSQDTMFYLGKRLAAVISQYLEACRPCSTDDVRAMTCNVDLQTRTIPWSMEDLQARIVVLEAEIARRGPAQWLPGDHVTNRAKRHPLPYSLYAARCAKRCIERTGQIVRVQVSGLRLGDCILVGFPGEPFSNVSLELPLAAPGSNVFVLGYTNGYVYYLPNQRDLDEVDSWTLDEFLSQENRWAYGATSSAFWSGESCEAAKAAARTLVESLATGE
jgi:neutral ceramidase